MAKPPEWSVLIRCTHKKHFWIPITVFLDPQVTSYGCGCPEGGSKYTPTETPASNRAINRAVRKLRREMRKL